MANSATKRLKKDAYLPVDTVFGRYTYYFEHGGFYLFLFVSSFYTVIGGIIGLVYLVKGTPMKHFWRMFLKVSYSASWLPALIGLGHAAIVFCTLLSVKESILLKVLEEVNSRSKKGSTINWRQIAHRANKLAKDRGQKSNVFYSGDHCISFFSDFASSVKKGHRWFKNNKHGSEEAHQTFAKEVVKKYDARMASLYEVESVSPSGQ